MADVPIDRGKLPKFIEESYKCVHSLERLVC